MEIVDIFVVEKGTLYAVQYDKYDCDEFVRAFRQWNDTEYLDDFFETHKADLSGIYTGISVEQAILRNINEAGEFEYRIRDVAKDGSFEDKNSLQDLVFYPLHKNDTNFVLQESKAYGTEHKSWLRIYAIRIDAQCYVVSGSAIKLTGTMQERSHTNDELKKLKITADELKKRGYSEADDFGYIDYPI